MPKHQLLVSYNESSKYAAVAMQRYPFFASWIYTRYRYDRMFWNIEEWIKKPLLLSVSLSYDLIIEGLENDSRQENKIGALVRSMQSR